MKRLSRKERRVYLESRSAIRVKDFDNELYIALNGVPLLPIDNNWTAARIVETLNNLREGYMKYSVADGQSFISFKDYVNRNQSKDS